ncbi:MAG: DUF3465 domain-containing protein [Clostridiales bacterium]|nr:DUF3465 domain-containing protein [Clostridiales bacterium]
MMRGNILILILILILCSAVFPGCHKDAVRDNSDGQPVSQEATGQGDSEAPGQSGLDAPAPSDSDETIGRLFANQESDVQVKGEGVVIRLLDDDEKGSRHQRFILELASGQTLLMAHNIDIAPRLDGLAVGDTVGFYGEYVYTDKGGTVHWTHHDPGGRHVSGWLEWGGERYK